MLVATYEYDVLGLLDLVYILVRHFCSILLLSIRVILKNKQIMKFYSI